MKRLILLALWGLLSISIVGFMNCSNPLETTDDGELNPPGPVIVIDTVYITDTVYIYEPDPGETQTVCSILLSNLNEIIWMFHNQAGTYNLKFTADPVRDFTFRTLTIDVNGNPVTWYIEDEPEFAIEAELDALAIIRILTDQPCLAGHEVDICLAIGKP